MSINQFTKLWDDVSTTDPKHTTKFERGGGFRGTAINATWLEQQATAHFGPKGIGWGVEVEDEKFITGHMLNERDNAIIHVVRIRLWYIYESVRGEIVQYGQTTMVGSNKYGAFTDEEAPKKSLTDATTKALSGLGFSADVFLGLYDDNKYVAEVAKQFAGPSYTAEQKAAFDGFTTGSALGLYLFRKRVGDDIYTDLYNSFPDGEKMKGKKLCDDQEKIGAEVFAAIMEHLEGGDEAGVYELLEDESNTVVALLKAAVTTKQRDEIAEIVKQAKAA